ncbi:putative proline-rich receptor-like protein kinase PERK6 [Pecten maximus]|uniref:putative proline-rich receptor-like protein kinase PERK6 n=1 Tax=Pecten maximus TaxID=6579 RepID=UPI00145823DC|nr:putative proline-rich receptor-like protein kinase PERK6 [Pecten maximus]
MASKYTCMICVAIFFAVIGFAASETCYSSKSYYNFNYGTTTYQSDSKYCYTGCCSTYGLAASCCSSNIYYNYYTVVYYTTYLSTAAIIGIVVGCLAGLGIFIAIIICCCCAICRNRGSPQGGQVLAPMGGVGATVIATQNTTTQQAYPQAQPSPAMGQPYPGYNPAFTPDSAPTAAPGSAPYAPTAAPPPYSNKY